MLYPDNFDHGIAFQKSIEDDVVAMHDQFPDRKRQTGTTGAAQVGVAREAIHFMPQSGSESFGTVWTVFGDMRGNRHQIADSGRSPLDRELPLRH